MRIYGEKPGNRVFLYAPKNEKPPTHLPECRRLFMDSPTAEKHAAGMILTAFRMLLSHKKEAPR